MTNDDIIEGSEVKAIMPAKFNICFWTKLFETPTIFFHKKNLGRKQMQFIEVLDAILFTIDLER